MVFIFRPSKTNYGFPIIVPTFPYKNAKSDNIMQCFFDPDDKLPYDMLFLNCPSTHIYSLADHHHHHYSSSSFKQAIHSAGMPPHTHTHTLPVLH